MIISNTLSFVTTNSIAALLRGLIVYSLFASSISLSLGAAEPTGWFNLGQAWSKSPSQSALQETRVRVYGTQTHVVAEFKATDADAANRAISKKENTWELGDVLELFLEDPRADYYTEWHVTPEGRSWSKRFFTQSPGGQRNWESEPIENADWLEVSSEVKDGILTARIIVPYEAFSVDGQRPPVIRWVTCRIDASLGEQGSEPVLSSSGAFPAHEKGLSFHRDRSFWHTTDFSNGFAWTGVDHFVLTPDGVIPRRVTPTTLQAMSKAEAFVAQLSSGVKLQLPAEGAKGLDVTIRTINDDDYPTNWALYLDDLKVHPTISVAAGSKEPRTLSWKLPRNAEGQTLTLYFPTHAEVELRRVEVKRELTGQASISAPLTAERPPEGSRMRISTTQSSESEPNVAETRWLVHGDSITHGANVTSPDFTWVEQSAQKLGWKPINFGFGGIARAQPFFAEAIAARNDWDVLSLHIGTNSYREDAAAYEVKYNTFLDTIRAAHPEKPIICVTLI